MSEDTVHAQNVRGGFYPRHTGSPRATPLPSELLHLIGVVFTQQFVHEAEVGEFLPDGRIFEREIILRIGYLEKGRLRQFNFEASIDLPQSGDVEERQQLLRNLTTRSLAKANAGEPSDDVEFDSDEPQESILMDRIYICIDALGSLMEEHFELGEEEDSEIPPLWTPLDFEGETIFVQQNRVNTRLEEEADRLLGLLDDELVEEGLASEDALDVAEIDNEGSLRGAVSVLKKNRRSDSSV